MTGTVRIIFILSGFLIEILSILNLFSETVGDAVVSSVSAFIGKG